MCGTCAGLPSCLDKYRPNPQHELTQYTKPFDSLTEPAFHTCCGCVNNVISAGALYGSNREKAIAWQDACCSVTQLSSHVAHQQNSSWVNIDCLTGCLWSVWVAITPSLVHNRTMSSNTNIFLKRMQVIFSSSPFITVYRLYFPPAILQCMPCVVIFFQMSPIFHCFLQVRLQWQAYRR